MKATTCTRQDRVFAVRVLSSGHRNKRGLKRRKARSPQTGDRLGTKGPSSNEEVRRWKAPRMRRNALFFAEGCGRRSFPGKGESLSWVATRESARDGGLERCRGHSSHEGREHATRGVRADWVGAKPSNASNRGEGEPARHCLNTRRSLTHDSSVPHPRKGAVGPGGAPGRKPGNPPKPWGFVGPSVVLADHVDCRSRRAARGAERSRAMSPRKRRCLASPLRETKKRRKPDPDGKILGTGGGLAPEVP
jgi:hypothetical protein